MNTTTEKRTRGTTEWTGIDVLRIAVVVAMVGAAVYLAASLVTALTSDSLASPLELRIPPDSITVPEEATVIDASAQVNVRTGLGYRLGWWAVTDGLAVSGIGFLELLRRILAKGTDPFSDTNVSRLRGMAILAVSFAGVSLIRPLVSFAIQDNAGLNELGASWDLSSLTLALVLVALLEIWRHGAELRSERDLTI